MRHIFKDDAGVEAIELSEIHNELLALISPAWDARERRITQMTKEIEDVNNEVCGSQGVFFGHALKNIRAMKERDNQQYHALREAEAAREALRQALQDLSAAVTARLQIDEGFRGMGFSIVTEKAGMLRRYLRAAEKALSPVPADPRPQGSPLVVSHPPCNGCLRDDGFSEHTIFVYDRGPNSPPGHNIVHMCPECDQTRESGKGHTPDCHFTAVPPSEAPRPQTGV